METKIKKTPTRKTSMSLPVVDITNKEIGSIQLPADIFRVTASDKLLALYVRVYLNNQKHNAAFTKTRSEVKGSTRKIYRQKGTGRARHGANKAPIFVGGGIAHGPRGIIKKLLINKKQRTRALFVALSNAFKEGRMKFALDTAKIDGTTKQLSSTLATLGHDKKILLIYSGSHESMIGQAAKNLDATTVSQAETLNAYHIIGGKSILFTKTGLEQFLRGRAITK